jgi:hypothetical protein
MLLGFWTLSIMWFSKQNTTFWKLYLFPSSGWKTPSSVGFIFTSHLIPALFFTLSGPKLSILVSFKHVCWGSMAYTHLEFVLFLPPCVLNTFMLYVWTFEFQCLVRECKLKPQQTDFPGKIKKIRQISCDVDDTDWQMWSEKVNHCD